MFDNQKTIYDFLKIFQKVLNEIIEGNNPIFEDKEDLSSRFINKWGELQEIFKEGPEFFEKYEAKLSEAKLTGEDLALKMEVFEYIRKKWQDTKDKLKKWQLAEILLGLINSTLGSIFSACRIPSIEALKEFKDLLEAGIKLKNIHV